MSVRNKCVEIICQVCSAGISYFIIDYVMENYKSITCQNNKCSGAMSLLVKLGTYDYSELMGYALCASRRVHNLSLQSVKCHGCSLTILHSP